MNTFICTKTGKKLNSDKIITIVVVVLWFFGKYPTTYVRCRRTGMAQKFFLIGPGIFNRAERKVVAEAVIILQSY